MFNWKNLGETGKQASGICFGDVFTWASLKIKGSEKLEGFQRIDEKEIISVSCLCKPGMKGIGMQI